MQVLYNARIYTLDEAQPLVSAVAVDQGRIIAAGESGTIREAFGSRGEVLDLQGMVVIPGLTDAHIHMEQYALVLQKVDCRTASRHECLERVRERARDVPREEWILGHGWNQNHWEQGFGNASMLDEVAPQNPVYLTANNLHAAWANSAALKLAGINRDTPDPRDGRIGRDPQGEPDGILFESALELVARMVLEPTVEEVARAIRSAQPVLWSMGLTGYHDFDRSRCFGALQRLHQRGELGLRVLKSIPLEDLPHAAALGLGTGFGDDMLRIGGVKIFADGALGPRTAAMLQPFDGEAGNTGMLFLDAEELFEHGRMAVNSRLSLAVHAIGDRANHEALKAFEHLRRYEGKVRQGANLPERERLRHRIEHVQLIHPDDAPLLARLGVVASMQPIHATFDMRMVERYWSERAAHAFGWRTQLDHGAVLAFGSDAPVETPNPFAGLHAAVTRRRADGAPSAEGWHPEQRISLMEALRAYTTGAAYAAGMEDRLGMLAPGFLADLVVLDRDPFACEPDELLEIKVRRTMVAGEWVFEAD